MSTIKPIQLGTGILYVEMDEIDIPLPQNVGEPSTPTFEDTPEDAKLVGFKENLEEAASTLRSTLDALTTDVAEALSKAAPSEWSLEFNIGFKGKTNPIPVLVSGEGNVALKLTATWRRE